MMVNGHCCVFLSVAVQCNEERACLLRSNTWASYLRSTHTLVACTPMQWLLWQWQVPLLLTSVSCHVQERVSCCKTIGIQRLCILLSFESRNNILAKYLYVDRWVCIGKSCGALTIIKLRFTTCIWDSFILCDLSIAKIYHGNFSQKGVPRVLSRLHTMSAFWADDNNFVYIWWHLDCRSWLWSAFTNNLFQDLCIPN